MAMSPRLDLRLSQSMAMTPQLQQAIKLLALSNLELEGVLAEELAKNPLLENGNDNGDSAPQRQASDAAPATDILFEAGMGAAGGALDADYSAETFHHDSPSDSAWEQPAPAASGAEDSSGGSGAAGGEMGGMGPGDGRGEGSGSGEAIDFDSFGGPEISLREHLLAQAGAALSGPAHAIAVSLIEAIDDAGYCDADLVDLARRLGVPVARIEDVLHVVQSFDPTGVGARTLSECLMLQAKEADRYDPCMAVLFDNLDLLASGQMAKLKRKCRVDDEDMADMIRELRGYDPKPGLRFAPNDATPVVPDLFVRPTVEGWAIEINSATLPRLLVNQRYYAELSAQTAASHAGKPAKAAAKTWLSDCFASAHWLVKALDQRQQTIIKVATEIVKQQEGFFLHGVGALKPLTLHQVSEAIEMHDSTVSRATSNKYLSCSRGVYELKYFFSSGVMGEDAEGGMSAEAVKSRIARLIEAEDPTAILSDDTIVELLAKDGCALARRTVAKYREAMGLGSSVQRRRAKAMGR
jgi:RNA polymerase sigma-54 factor